MTVDNSDLRQEGIQLERIYRKEESELPLQDLGRKFFI